MPKFSVVISVYNKGDFIKNTLQSVLAQSVEDYEIIIVNDASSDHSEKTIQTVVSDKITYHAFSENKGAAATRNKGIALASGTYIALLDGDDIWDIEYLEEINTLIEKFPDHQVFATAITIEEHDGKRPSQYTFSNPENAAHLSLNYFESSYKNTLLTSSSTVIKKTIFDHIGTYDTSIKSGQDTDLWIRVGIHYPIAFSTRSCASYTYAPISLYKSIRSVKHRPNFVAYETIEKENKALKKFLDLNRFSLVIRAKHWNEPKEAQFFIDRIDPKSLSKKQLKLLNAPAFIIKLLFGIKRILEKLGIRLGVY
ncbi:glycosyltransferase family 2 protein [uncultured Dokdonia sp.]|uniref:glycosyltransferase family 2 protein n=1 Tax=uncultured Dokdonia sp. TaxID=575653 RepID=UPI002623F6F5|nr:glycosyltransferase family 2 protein [uncultured Dokdonia sp.]